MKALKIKLYQEMVNYRKSYAYNFLETYPLPTPAMIKGWIYAVTDENLNFFNDTIESLSIGITGNSTGYANNLQHFIKLKNIKKQDDIIRDLQTRTPTYVTLLSSIELVLYISADDRLLKKFRKNIFNTFPSLGRYEDLANIQHISLVDIEQREIPIYDTHQPDYVLYLTEKSAKKSKLKGSYLRLPTYYQLKNDMRIFNNVNLLYYHSQSPIQGTFYFDNSEGQEGRIVDLIPFKNDETVLSEI